MADTWPAFRGAFIGAAALVAITSAAAAGAAARHMCIVEPAVWVRNPLGPGVAQSLVWHLAIAIAFGAAATLGCCNAAARTLRGVTAAALVLVSLLAFKDGAAYYRLLAIGRIATNLPIPLRAGICLLTVVAAAITWRGGRRASPSPHWAAVAIAGIGAVCGAASLLLWHIVSFGFTDYFHLARCKMLFAEQGIQCATVPAHMKQRLTYEPFYIARECVAYLAYCVGRPCR